MKLVKDQTLVDFIKVDGSLEASFRRARYFSKEEKWDRIIIIGEGRNTGRSIYSGLNEDEILGLLTRAKYAVIKSDFAP